MSQTNREKSEADLICVEKINKSFREISVLKQVSFTVKNREIIGVIGPSGGGKTTLLRCLDFLVRIEGGSIKYNFIPSSLVIDKSGISQATVGPVSKQDKSSEVANILRKNIGFVFQGYNLWEDRTILSNLILAPMVVRAFHRDTAEQMAYEFSKQFGIEDKLSAKAWQLSGGQKQRVAIIRALMMEPRIILLDEVTSALDPVLTLGVMEAISSRRDRGLTMIIVSHHIEFVSSLCDRVIFLSKGQIEQIDTPEVLKRYPATNEVAKFLAILRATS